MLWCFPINFRKKTERTFDSSVLVAPDEMHLTRSAEHANDYTGNYLVPNRRGQGQGKPVVKRPPPPPTSQPLDDDFDAITQTQTAATTTRGGPETEWGTRVQESAVTRTSSPLPDDFDAVTNTVVTPGPQRYTPAGSYWDQRQQQQQHQQNRQRGHVYSHSVPVNGTKPYVNNQGPSHANAKPKGEFDHYGEYGRYMDERMFGGTTEAEVTTKKVGADVERRESRQVGRFPANSNARRGHTRGKLSLGDPRSQISRPTRLTPAYNRLSGRGPKPGQEYEMVDKRIVENTPERTVTIATWREQVAREADPNVERMSVYFMDADEYPVEETHNMEPVARVESRLNLDMGVNHENRSRTTIPDERYEEEYTRGSQEAKTIESDMYSIERASPKSEHIPTPPRKNSTSNSSYMRRSESQQQRTTNYSHNSRSGSNRSWNQILQPPPPPLPPVNRPGPAVHNTPPITYASPVVTHSTPVMEHTTPAVQRTTPPAQPIHYTPPMHHTPPTRHNTLPVIHHTPQSAHHTPQAILHQPQVTQQPAPPAVQYTPPMVDRTPPRIQTPERFQRTTEPIPPSPLNTRNPQRFEDSPRRSTPSPSPPRRLRTPLQESTPIKQRPSASSFHPTQSGSTISSIKELPVVRFDQILESCEPSLLHVSPILANMGITSEGHLKAMKRLSEETRDKELKEEALRLGMTVMEWAILLDKVQTM